MIFLYFFLSNILNPISVSIFKLSIKHKPWQKKITLSWARKNKVALNSSGKKILQILCFMENCVDTIVVLTNIKRLGWQIGRSRNSALRGEKFPCAASVQLCQIFPVCPCDPVKALLSLKNWGTAEILQHGSAFQWDQVFIPCLFPPFLALVLTQLNPKSGFFQAGKILLGWTKISMDRCHKWQGWVGLNQTVGALSRALWLHQTLAQSAARTPIYW